MFHVSFQANFLFSYGDNLHEMSNPFFNFRNLRPLDLRPDLSKNWKKCSVNYFFTLVLLSLDMSCF